jgi:hypothetical protein
MPFLLLAEKQYPKHPKQIITINLIFIDPTMTSHSRTTKRLKSRMQRSNMPELKL